MENTTTRYGRGFVGLWLGLSCAVVLILAAFLLFRTEETTVRANVQRQFTLPVEFDNFRQMLVRTDATQSIVEHGGMKLLDKSIESLHIDLSRDSRPLLNALKGKSKADLSARRRLTVQMIDPQLEANELSLTQIAEIHPDNVNVLTASDRAAGKLEAYQSKLEAVKANGESEVKLATQMAVVVRVSPLFLSVAKARVAKAASDGLRDQEAAIRDLVARHDERSFILPTLGP